MKFNYDFSKGTIKHLIEKEFYTLASVALPKLFSATVVTGPDYQRHVDNVKNILKCKSFRICEIDLDIFIDIYKGLKQFPLIRVENKSIEQYGSLFIDCDLTCISDIETIQNTLLKQISVQSTSRNFKIFIFSFSLRSQKTKSLEQYIRPIFGLLGSHVTYTINNFDNVFNTKGTGNYCNSIKINKTLGRIKNYKLYSYNAGGGPMITCYIEYK